MQINSVLLPSDEPRRRISSAMAVVVDKEQESGQEPDSTGPDVISQYAYLSHLTSHDRFSIDHRHTSSSHILDAYQMDSNSSSIITCEEPDHVYVPVPSAIVGRVYRRVPRDQALTMLTLGVHDDSFRHPSTTSLHSSYPSHHLDGHPQSPSQQVYIFFVLLPRISLLAARLIPLILVGFTILEALLHCTQPTLGPLIKVYIPVAYPLTVITDILISFVVTVRLVHTLFYISINSSIYPIMEQPSQSQTIPSRIKLLTFPNNSVSPSIISSLSVPTRKKYHLTLNQSHSLSPNRLSTVLYLIALIASTCTFPFVDDLDMAHAGLQRSASGKWINHVTLTLWIQSNSWTNLPSGWTTSIMVWSVATVIRMAALGLGVCIDLYDRIRFKHICGPELIEQQQQQVWGPNLSISKSKNISFSNDINKVKGI